MKSIKLFINEANIDMSAKEFADILSIALEDVINEGNWSSTCKAYNINPSKETSFIYDVARSLVDDDVRGYKIQD